MWKHGKNKKTGKSTIYLNPEHKQARDLIIYKINQVNRQKKWNKQKVWVSIFVQKPSMRADGINMLDGIAHAVKQAIGVDDNWFAVREIDWEIKKNDPQIFIKVEQESEENDFEKRVAV